MRENSAIWLFYVSLYSNGKDVSGIHFLKVLETKHKGLLTCRRKVTLKPMETAKSVVKTLPVCGIPQLLANPQSPSTNLKESHHSFWQQRRKLFEETRYCDHVGVEKLGHIFGFFKGALIHSRQPSCNNLYQMRSALHHASPPGELPKEGWWCQICPQNTE